MKLRHQNEKEKEIMETQSTCVIIYKMLRLSLSVRRQREGMNNSRH